VIFPGVKAENLIIGLDLEGIAVSAGAACSSGKIGGSHVLKAMNYTKEHAMSAIRLSFGWNNNEEQVQFFLDSINNLLQGMKFKY
jgi:cysteine desulfurase